MASVSVLFAIFPGSYRLEPDSIVWIEKTKEKARKDSRFDRIKMIEPMDVAGTPITMLRNRAVQVALENGFDYLCMVDADMAPDKQGRGENGWIPSDKPFWESSWDFIFEKHLHKPCMIFAPYVGPPPHENVYVFLWRSRQSANPNVDHQLEGYTREEAALMAGIQPCAAGPTGVILIDMRGIEFMTHPLFYYGYEGPKETKKVMTEDVAFTRDWTMTPAPKYGCKYGMPLYCNWDAWACHWKLKACGKPELLRNEQVSETYREAALRNINAAERQVLLGDVVEQADLQAQMNMESLTPKSCFPNYADPCKMAEENAV